MRHEHGTKELTQAVLEGVAFAFGDCQQVLLDTGAEIDEVSLIGGGSKSHLWAQILASVLERPMIRHDSPEMGPALGAARLAMLASNNGSLEEICQRPGIKEIVEPNLNMYLSIDRIRNVTEDSTGTWKKIFWNSLFTNNKTSIKFFSISISTASFS